MKWYYWALFALFTISLAGGLIWSANHYSVLYEAEKKNAEKEKIRADNAESLAKQRQSTIDDMQVRQRDVAALDDKYTKELADAKAENDALQRKLDNGGRVLVKGNCPAVSKVTTAASTSGMDDGGTVELSATAGRNVLDSREGIKRDQAALRGLQQYIREQCFK